MKNMWNIYYKKKRLVYIFLCFFIVDKALHRFIIDNHFRIIIYKAHNSDFNVHVSFEIICKIHYELHLYVRIFIVKLPLNTKTLWLMNFSCSYFCWKSYIETVPEVSTSIISIVIAFLSSGVKLCLLYISW